MTKILLVEDDKSLREIYGVRLQAEGYEIVSAGDGEEALALAIKEQPALILSDVMMPKISGFDMLDILRSTTETKDVKVIMMTALSSDDQRARGEALGADRYLVKSQVGIEDVVRTVHDVLGDGIPAPATAPTFPPASAIPAAPIAPTAAPAEAAPAPAPVEPAIMPTPNVDVPAPVSPEPQPAPTPIATEPSPVAPTMPAVEPTPVAPVEPTPVAAPAPDFAPQPAPEPAPAMPSAPITPAPEPTPIPTPIPAPQPVLPPAPTPAANPLPEPTAPFSTPRPGSGSVGGDRVIAPLPSADSLTQTGDIASQMNQALASDPLQQPPQPPVQPQ